jgi:hypothetical protein
MIALQVQKLQNISQCHDLDGLGVLYYYVSNKIKARTGFISSELIFKTAVQKTTEVC